jgi:hypothetical protein
VPLFGRSERNLRDHRHVSSLLNRIRLKEFGIVLQPTMVFDERGHRENRTRYFGFGYEGERRAPQGQFPTLDSFYGQGDALEPDAAAKDMPAYAEHRAEFDGKEACCALKFAAKKLAPGASREFTLLLGIADSDAEISSLFGRLDKPAKVEKAFEATGAYWRSYLSGLSVDFKDRERSGWLAWVTLQPALRKLRPGSAA